MKIRLIKLYLIWSMSLLINYIDIHYTYLAQPQLQYEGNYWFKLLETIELTNQYTLIYIKAFYLIPALFFIPILAQKEPSEWITPNMLQMLEFKNGFTYAKITFMLSVYTIGGSVYGALSNYAILKFSSITNYIIQNLSALWHLLIIVICALLVHLLLKHLLLFRAKVQINIEILGTKD